MITLLHFFPFLFSGQTLGECLSENIMNNIKPAVELHHGERSRDVGQWPQGNTQKSLEHDILPFQPEKHLTIQTGEKCAPAL